MSVSGHDLLWIEGDFDGGTRATTLSLTQGLQVSGGTQHTLSHLTIATTAGVGLALTDTSEATVAQVLALNHQGSGIETFAWHLHRITQIESQDNKRAPRSLLGLDLTRGGLSQSRLVAGSESPRLHRTTLACRFVSTESKRLALRRACFRCSPPPAPCHCLGLIWPSLQHTFYLCVRPLSPFCT